MEFTTIGETVNISAKIEKLNKVIGVSALATKKAYELARQQGYADHTERSSKSYPIEDLAYPTLDLVILHEKAKTISFQSISNSPKQKVS